MPAVPSVVVILITVSSELGTSIVTGTVAVPAPSSTVTSPIVTTGVASLSSIVTVPGAWICCVFHLLLFRQL